MAGAVAALAGALKARAWSHARARRAGCLGLEPLERVQDTAPLLGSLLGSGRIRLPGSGQARIQSRERPRRAPPRPPTHRARRRFPAAWAAPRASRLSARASRFPSLSSLASRLSSGRLSGRVAGSHDTPAAAGAPPPAAGLAGALGWRGAALRRRAGECGHALRGGRSAAAGVQGWKGLASPQPPQPRQSLSAQRLAAAVCRRRGSRGRGRGAYGRSEPLGRLSGQTLQCPSGTKHPPASRACPPSRRGLSNS